MNLLQELKNAAPGTYLRVRSKKIKELNTKLLQLRFDYRYAKDDAERKSIKEKGLAIKQELYELDDQTSLL